MPYAHVNDLDIAYELIGEGRPWVITPGGRFSKDDGGIRELAEALAAEGNQVLIWDRPNCGASRGVLHRRVGVDHAGRHARRADRAPRPRPDGDHRRLGRRPRLDAHRGSAPRARGRSRDVVDQRRPVRAHEPGRALLRAEPREGVDGGHGRRRRARPSGRRCSQRNPSNRQRILDQDREEFVRTMERWMLVYCPCDDQLVPGRRRRRRRAHHHARRSCSAAARATRGTRARRRKRSPRACPNARLVEPPWGDREWLDRSAARLSGEGALFGRWPLLAPTLVNWAKEELD